MTQRLAKACGAAGARFAGLLILIACLSACVTETRRTLDDAVAQEIPEETPETRRRVHQDLIQKMLDQGQYYAAIAHVQAQTGESGLTPELALLEAEARRKLGQTAEAKALYRKLLRSSYVAQAYHGLGLTNVKTDLATAVWQLQQAVERQPTDAQMRNDLGYALMIAGRHSESLPELATAVELASGRASEKARHNLILLLMVTGDASSARRLIRESGLSDETVAGLRRQAENIGRRGQHSQPPPSRVTRNPS